MEQPHGVSAAVAICVIDDAGLRRTVERVAAAAGVRLVLTAAPGRRHWITAAAVITDEAGARRCAENSLPRRDGVILVSGGDPSPATWAAALAAGAHDICVLPDGENHLLTLLADAAEKPTATARPGRLIAVTSGRGGAGASVFAAALAQSAASSTDADALLVDLDPFGGGLDLLVGAERTPGLRWPDIHVDGGRDRGGRFEGGRFEGGRINWSSLRAVLPRAHDVFLLSSGRAYHDIEAGLVTAVIESGRRSGVTVVCDVPRQLTAAAVCALETADVAVIVTTCDVRAIAAAASLTGVIRSVNPNVGLVVRGPAPGGLRAAEAADVAAAPLLATMRPEPMLAAHLDQHGLRMAGRRGRSPLATAAGKVLGLLGTGVVPA